MISNHTCPRPASFFSAPTLNTSLTNPPSLYHAWYISSTGKICQRWSKVQPIIDIKIRFIKYPSVYLISEAVSNMSQAFQAIGSLCTWRTPADQRDLCPPRKYPEKPCPACCWSSVLRQAPIILYDAVTSLHAAFTGRIISKQGVGVERGEPGYSRQSGTVSCPVQNATSHFPTFNNGMINLNRLNVLSEVCRFELNPMWLLLLHMNVLKLYFY